MNLQTQLEQIKLRYVIPAGLLFGAGLVLLFEFWMGK
jgi:hypothetical protein